MLGGVDGVTSASFTFETGVAVVQFDSGNPPDIDALIRALADVGTCFLM